LITGKEAAKILNLFPSQVKDLIIQGELPGVTHARGCYVDPIGLENYKKKRPKPISLFLIQARLKKIKLKQKNHAKKTILICKNKMITSVLMKNLNQGPVSMLL
jgi:hypothetical protein